MTHRGKAASFALIEHLVSLALLSAIAVLVLGGFQTARRIRDTSRIAEDRGAADAASPPRWRAEWLGMARLPALIAARMVLVRAGLRQVIEIHVAPRQS